MGVVRRIENSSIVRYLGLEIRPQTKLQAHDSGARRIRHDKRSWHCVTSPYASRSGPELLPGLREIKSVENFSRGEHCFNSVSLPLGVYPVERGEVRILLSTGQKQRQLLEAVVSGVGLGFGESLTGKNHRITAEAWDKTSLAFIPRETFHEIPRGRGDVCMEILQLLGDDLHGLYRKFPSISAHPGGPRHRPFDEQLNESARSQFLILRHDNLKRGFPAIGLIVSGSTCSVVLERPRGWEPRTGNCLSLL